MNGKCKNCKWWNRELTEKNSCDRETQADNEMFNIVVDVDDDSGLSANLITSPEFGCNQFEKKLDK